MGRRAEPRRRGSLHLAHPAEGVALGVAGVLVAATLVAALNGSHETSTSARVNASATDSATDSSGAAVSGDRFQALAQSLPPVTAPSHSSPIGRGVLRLAPPTTPAHRSTAPASTSPTTATTVLTPSHSPTSTPSPATPTTLPTSSPTSTPPLASPSPTAVSPSTSATPSETATETSTPATGEVDPAAASGTDGEPSATASTADSTS